MNSSQQKIGGKTILCDITSFPHNNCFLTKVSLSGSQLLIWIWIRRSGRCGSAEEPPQRLPWTFSYLRSCENTSLLWDNLGLFLNSLAGHGLLLAFDHMTQTPRRNSLLRGLPRRKWHFYWLAVGLKLSHLKRNCQWFRGSADSMWEVAKGIAAAAVWSWSHWTSLLLWRHTKGRAPSHWDIYEQEPKDQSLKLNWWGKKISRYVTLI